MNDPSIIAVCAAALLSAVLLYRLTHGQNRGQGRPGVDRYRVERLEDLLKKTSPSIQAELLTLVFAILIGIGVGFFFVQWFFPNLVSR